MIVAILLNFLLIVLGTVFVIFLSFDGVFTVWNMTDAGFIVSILVFFMGLLTFSNATQVLQSTGYVLKELFLPRRSEYKSYYDYKQDKKEVRRKGVGLPTLIAGTIALAIDLVVAILLMNGIL
jgi:hypothetical protein